jgi:hypothetical protein
MHEIDKLPKTKKGKKERKIGKRRRRIVKLRNF